MEHFIADASAATTANLASAAAFKIFTRKVGEEGQEVWVTPESTVGEIKAQRCLKGYSLRFNRYSRRCLNANVKMTDLGVQAGETIAVYRTVYHRRTRRRRLRL